jgi:hypothetical protein
MHKTISILVILCILLLVYLACLSELACQVWLLLLMHVSCMLGAAHGCSSCMLGANTITGDPMQLGMPMIPSTWYQSIWYQYPHFLKKTHHYATPPKPIQNMPTKHLKYMANPLQYKSIWQSRCSVSQSHHDTDQQSC